MKKLFIAITAFIFSACAQPHQPLSKSDSLLVDSITTAGTAEKKIKTASDSIEASKALGNIDFGITAKQFEKEQAKFLKARIYKKDYTNTYHIGGYQFYNLRGYYYNKKLYSIEVQGNMVRYQDYDTETKEQVLAIYNVLKEKYGEPKEDFGLIPWYKTKEDRWYRLAYWMIGNKVISIQMSNHGTHNSIDLNIYRDDVQELINKEEEAKKDSLVSKGTNDL